MHPFLFKGTPFETPSWDVVLLIGFIIVLLIGLILKPKDFPVTRLGIIAFALISLFVGSLGGKLLYVFIHRETLFNVMHLSFGNAFISSGYAFLGTLGFVLIAMAAFAKLRPRPVSFLACADFGLPLIILHQAFTRIGCFMAGCCYGPVTGLPWGCYFAGETLKRQPTQIYFAISLLVIFFYALYLLKKNLPKGVVFFTALFTYGLSRCILESWRVDSPHILGPVTLAQAVTFTLAAVSGVCLYVILARNGLIISRRKL
ncbi:MAG: prolipoprotein diacylglyceryl transferase [Candidatus Omnitrophica bacterium]|nr:prolipoprotein diacylglyceryl transferase [Candidatus Omnitrophota bacterium]MBU1807995.1 prolipoprotein diacylglyceryl transferase [Candidatus Omnitrophota bacterium]